VKTHEKTRKTMKKQEKHRKTSKSRQNMKKQEKPRKT
jgi:hypothetical protein